MQTVGDKLLVTNPKQVAKDVVCESTTRCFPRADGDEPQVSRNSEDSDGLLNSRIQFSTRLNETNSTRL